ncbi:MAG: ABC transporter permease [Blastocatellia bacterium]
MQAAAGKILRESSASVEQARAETIRWASLVALSIRNWFISWTFFLPSFLINIVGLVASAAIFYFMGQVVAKGAEQHIAEYHLSYGSYIITGVMFTMVMDATLGTYHEAFLRAYWTNQFDVYLQHPGGVSALLTGEVIAKYGVAAINTVIYFLVAITLFRVPIHVNNLFDTFVVLVLSVLSLTGLGLMGASTFSLMNAKREETNPVKLIVGFGVTVLSGVYFPPDVLPQWLQKIGWWLPQTHALRAARLCVSGNASLGSPSLGGDITFLMLFAVFTLPIGVILFAAGIKKAQTEGSLTRWS